MTDDNLPALPEPEYWEWRKRVGQTLDYARAAIAAQSVELMVWREQQSRAMFVARLENMERNGDNWLSTADVLALLNDCDMLAARTAAPEPLLQAFLNSMAARQEAMHGAAHEPADPDPRDARIAGLGALALHAADLLDAASACEGLGPGDALKWFADKGEFRATLEKRL